MRLLSRLGSWLRADSDVDPSVIDDGPIPAPYTGTPARRLPVTPPEAFRDALLEAIDHAHEARCADVYRLDPSVHLLVIPPVYENEESEERRLATDLDSAIRRMQSDGRTLSSLTWSALRDARPAFEPTYSEWAGDDARRFEGEVGLIFFVDVEALSLAMAHAAQDLGFSARVDPVRPSVWITDGRFEAHVGVHALVAEALWTARGPLSVIRRRARSLPGEFRGFLATLSGLGRRYPGVRFDVDGGKLRVRTNGIDGRVNYRHLTASIRHAGLGVDRWLGRVTLEDLVTLDGDAGLMLRSSTYLRAWPEALAETHEEYAVVSVRHHEARVAPVLSRKDDPSDRFEHYRVEGLRQLGFLRFKGHAFVVREDEHAVVCFVGDGMASAALHESLLRGAIEQLAPLPSTVRVVAPSEDVLLVAHPEAPPRLVQESERRATQLERDLYDDPADRLRYDKHVALTESPAGHFELTLVPTDYFELCDDAAQVARSAPSQASYQRGLALEAIGRQDRAADAYERALRSDSSDGEVALALGRCLSSLGEFERAVPLLEQAERELPDRAEAANALGMALYSSGDSEGASRAFERAVALDPTESAFYVNLGRSHFDEEDFPAAEKALATALHLQPDCADAHATLALVSHRTGDNLKALHHAREALAEEPENPIMRRLLQALGVDDD